MKGVSFDRQQEAKKDFSKNVVIKDDFSFNLRTLEAEAGAFLGVQGYLGLQSEFKIRLNQIVKACIKEDQIGARDLAQ